MRDSAKRITKESSQASTISAIAMRMAKPAPPCRGRSSEDRANRASRRRTQSRKNSSAKKEMTPAMMTAIDHHAHIAVANVGELVAEHGLDLGVVEQIAAAR